MSWPSEEQHAASVKAFLTAAGVVPYDLDEVPANGTATRYVEVHLTAKQGGVRRLGYTSGVRGVRVALRPVAKSVTDVRGLLAKVDTLEDSTLTVGDYTSSPVSRDEAASTLIQYDRDSQTYTALRTFTYVV